MKSVARVSILAGILVALTLGGCSSQRRMESASGNAQDLSAPVSPRHHAAKKAAVEITPDQEKLVQNEVLALPEGLLNFDTPPALRRNSPVRLEARLSRDFLAKLTDALAAEPQLADVKIKDIMGLQLSAPGMTVKPLTSEEQMVGTDPTTAWAWEVNPSTLGRHSLSLMMVLHLSNAAGEKMRAYPVLERFVEVQDAEAGFFQTYGWWILALVLVAAAVVLLLKKP